MPGRTCGPVGPLASIGGGAVPVLIVNGEHDMPGFLDAAGALAAILPNCRRTSIQDGGGFPFWEFPGRVNETVRRFLGAA